MIAATATASGRATADDADEDDGKKKARCRPRDGIDDGDEGDSQPMALDPESSILQIGELASHHRHALLNSKGEVGDGDGDGPVEVATHVLDSMMIGGPPHLDHRGRAESSSSSSEVVTMDVDEDVEVEGCGYKGLVVVATLQRHQEEDDDDDDEEEDDEDQERRMQQLVTATTCDDGLELSQNRIHSLEQHSSLVSGVTLTEKQQSHHQLPQGQQQYSGGATMPTKQLSPLLPLPPPESGLVLSSSDHEQHQHQEREVAMATTTTTASGDCNDDVLM
jgi:hypothetical protein